MVDRIEILAQAEATNSRGRTTFVETVAATVDAHIRPLSVGQERYFGDQRDSVNHYIVTIRWPEGVIITNATVLRNKYTVNDTEMERRFDVKRVVDRDNRHEWLDIRCVEEGSEQR